MGINRRLPTNNLRRYGITHVLRIPIATPSSRPQLQRSLNSLRDDNLTRAIPYVAWSTVDSLVLHIGSLSLPNQAYIATARNILKKFDLNSSLGTASPLCVTVRSLISGMPGEQREYTQRLYSNVVFGDDTKLTAFLHMTNELRAAFGAEKLLVPERARLNPSVKLMNTRYLLSDVPNTKSTLAEFRWS